MMPKKAKPSPSDKTYYREERKAKTGFDIPHI